MTWQMPLSTFSKAGDTEKQLFVSALLRESRASEYDIKCAVSPFIEVESKDSKQYHTVVPICIFKAPELPADRPCIDIPHYTSQDGVYNGYFTPKCSLVIANISNDP